MKIDLLQNKEKVENKMLHGMKWTDNATARFWNNTDVLMDRGEKGNDYFGSMVGKVLLKHIDKMVNFKGKNVLDYGCGMGYLMRIISATYDVNSVYGCDLSTTSVDHVNLLKLGKNWGGAVQVASDGIPYDSNFFDVVILTEVVEHMDDDALNFAICEIKRMLKLGGMLVITTPNEEVLANGIVVCRNANVIFIGYNISAHGVKIHWLSILIILASSM